RSLSVTTRLARSSSGWSPKASSASCKARSVMSGNGATAPDALERATHRVHVLGRKPTNVPLVTGSLEGFPPRRVCLLALSLEDIVAEPNEGALEVGHRWRCLMHQRGKRVLVGGGFRKPAPH